MVEALLALDEPLRTTLILRFLEELPPRAVAARMDIPVETVRSRTRRGLGVLREQLDRSFGDRTSWCSALLPLLRRPSAVEALSTAFVVMSIPKKLALVVLVCALGWLAWPRREGGAEPVVALGPGAPAVLQEPPRPSAADLVLAGEPAARVDADGSFHLRSLRSQAALGACAAGYRPSEATFVGGNEGSEMKVRLVLTRGGGEVAGRIFDALTGRPLPGAFVGVGARTSMEFAEAGFLLRFENLDAREHRLAVSRSLFPSIERRGVRPDEGEVVLRVPRARIPSVRIEGVFLDELGQPIPGASVGPIVLPQGFSYLGECDEATGRFALGPLPSGSWGLRLEAPGRAPSTSVRACSAPARAGTAARSASRSRGESWPRSSRKESSSVRG